MLITKTSPLTGTENSMEIAIDEVTLFRVNNPDRHECIQDIVPNLTADEREFLLTGYTPEDWDTIYPPEDDSEALGDVPSISMTS